MKRYNEVFDFSDNEDEKVDELLVDNFELVVGVFVIIAVLMFMFWWLYF